MGWKFMLTWLSGLALALASAETEAARNPAYRIVHGWPVLPPGEVLGSAAGVGVTSRGNVLVFHRAERTWSEPLPTDVIASPTIAEFDGRTGKVVRQWGAGLFAMPHGLTIDDHDNVWLTDVSLQQVYKFSADGKLLLTVGERGVAGSDGRHFNRPTDIAVQPDGSFYVSDGYRNTRVAKFGPDGKFLFQWGTAGAGPGQFNVPHGIAVDAKGHVYVADRENDRVQIFDSRGRFLAQWKSPRIGRPYSIALLGSGLAAIVDGGEQPHSGPDRSGVTIVRLDGSLVGTFGRYGNYDGQFRMGHDLAADRSGNIYVVDITGQRVQKFAPANR